MPHPMITQLKADARGIFQDQGQDATFTPYDGDAVALTVVVLPQGPDVAGASPAGLSPEFGYPQATWAVVLVHADDLAARPERDDDTLAIDGTTYRVRQVAPEMGGVMWKLWCSTDEGGR